MESGGGGLGGGLPLLSPFLFPGALTPELIAKLAPGIDAFPPAAVPLLTAAQPHHRPPPPPSHVRLPPSLPLSSFWTRGDLQGDKLTSPKRAADGKAGPEAKRPSLSALNTSTSPHSGESPGLSSLEWPLRDCLTGGGDSGDGSEAGGEEGVGGGEEGGLVSDEGGEGGYGDPLALRRKKKTRTVFSRNQVFQA